MAALRQALSQAHPARTNVLSIGLIHVLILIVSLQIWLLSASVNTSLGGHANIAWTAFYASMALFLAGAVAGSYLPLPIRLPVVLERVEAFANAALAWRTLAISAVSLGLSFAVWFMWSAIAVKLKPDVVIAGGGPALEFLLKYRAVLFADVPIVHCAVEALPKEMMPDAKIVGIPMLRAAASTLELALSLQPDTRNVAVVAGSAPQDLESAEQFRRETPTFGDRVGFTWLTNLSLPDLRGELSRLPDHTVVLYLTMFQDAAGASFTPRQALTLFAPASRAPIYGCYDTYLGYGIVGGSMVTFEEIGRKAAQLGMRILAGEDAQTAARSESHQASCGDGTSARSGCRPAAWSGSKRPRIGSNITD
jgi:hypothetical protein